MQVKTLTPFTFWGWEPPYRYEGRPVVMPARCKSGLATTERSGLAHQVKALACVIENGRVCYGARWECGGYSTAAVLLPPGIVPDALCQLCEDAGPVVYRYFNSVRDVLYIGSSEQGYLRRAKAHARSAIWWPDVADVAVKRYPSLIEARLAERAAIAAENPIHNKAGKRTSLEAAS